MDLGMSGKVALVTVGGIAIGKGIARSLGRTAEVDEVADLVTCLVSDRAHFVHGTIVEFGGGQRKSLMDMSRDRR